MALGWLSSSGLSSSILPADGKFGKQIINVDTRKSVDEKLGRIFIHEGYKGEDLSHDKNKMLDDIAIIVLPTEVDFPDNSDLGNFWDDHAPNPKLPRGTFVRPICMPDLVKENQVPVRPLNPWTFKNSVDSDCDKDDLWITGFGKKHTETEKKFTRAKDLQKAYTAQYGQTRKKRILKRN